MHAACCAESEMPLAFTVALCNENDNTYFNTLLERGQSWGIELKSVVAVAHEMARVVYFMLRRSEPYRGQNRELTERKLKGMERRVLNGLRN